jgi:hypothetical protein
MQKTNAAMRDFTAASLLRPRVEIEVSLPPEVPRVKANSNPHNEIEDYI